MLFLRESREMAETTVIQHWLQTRRSISGSDRRLKKATADAPLPTFHHVVMGHVVMGDQKGLGNERVVPTVNRVNDTSLLVGLLVVSGSEQIHSFGTTMQCPSSTKPTWRIRFTRPAPNSSYVNGLASEADAIWSSCPIFGAERHSCFAVSKAFLPRATACITHFFSGLGSKPISICRFVRCGHRASRPAVRTRNVDSRFSRCLTSVAW